MLVPYDSRRKILSSLSAFDIAKLDLALGRVLDKTESCTYLNPVRDIIWNTSEMSNLIKEGMKLIICGNDVPDLFVCKGVTAFLRPHLFLVFFPLFSQRVKRRFFNLPTWTPKDLITVSIMHCAS